MCFSLGPWMTSRTHGRDASIPLLAGQRQQKGVNGLFSVTYSAILNFPCQIRAVSLLQVSILILFPLFVLPEVLFSLFMVLTYFEVPLISDFRIVLQLCFEGSAKFQFKYMLKIYKYFQNFNRINTNIQISMPNFKSIVTINTCTYQNTVIYFYADLFQRL